VRPLLARKKSSPLLSPGTLQLNLMTAPGGKIYKNAFEHQSCGQNQRHVGAYVQRQLDVVCQQRWSDCAVASRPAKMNQNVENLQPHDDICCWEAPALSRLHGFVCCSHRLQVNCHVVWALRVGLKQPREPAQMLQKSTERRVLQQRHEPRGRGWHQTDVAVHADQ
jgi:hypothetical protein